jgi:putative phosphoesterase
MSDKVLVVGDTHSVSFESLPKMMLQLIREVDWVIHVGDYTSVDVLSGFIRKKGPRFRGVYGNADPLQVRNRLMEKDIIEISNKKIGIIHPASGGSSRDTKKKVQAEFKNDDLDAIIYGHTHESNIEIVDGILLINPGKGYLEKSYFGPPPSLAILRIGKRITGNIELIQF